MIDEPAMRCDQPTALALCIESRAHAVVVVGAIHVVLDVFFPRPDHLHRPLTCCAICTARTVPSNSRRRPKPPPSR